MFGNKEQSYEMKILKGEHNSNFPRLQVAVLLLLISIVIDKKNLSAENSTQQKNISSSTFANVLPSVINNKPRQQDRGTPHQDRQATPLPGRCVSL